MTQIDQRHITAYSVCILVGLFLGILIGTKMTTSDPFESGQNGGGGVSAALPPERRESERASHSNRPKPARPQPDEAAKTKFRHDQINSQINSLREKSQVRMIELKVRLGLSDDQVEDLERIVDERLTQYKDELVSQDPTLGIGWQIDMLDVPDRLAEKVLSVTQNNEYHLMKQRERDARIEATALIELSKLTTLDLSDKQRDEVFRILIEKTAADYEDSPAIPNFQALLETELPRANKTLEENIDRMKGVLDSNQLAIYRQRLKSELGMFNIIKSN